MSDKLAVYGAVDATDGQSMDYIDKATGAVVFQVRSFAGGGNMQYKKVTLTATQVKALHAAPITLIADPGTGSFIQLLDALLYVNFVSAQYTAGSTVQFLLNSVAVATTTAALVNAAASATANIIQPAFPLIGTSNNVGVANSALTITAATTEFASGDSPINVHLWYSIVTL